MNGELDTSRFIQSQLLVMRIIIVSLLTGLIVFGAFVLTQRTPPPPNQQATLSLLAAPFVIICVILSIVVPRLSARWQMKALAEGRWAPNRRTAAAQSMVNTDEGKLLAIYQSQLILGCALLEGPGFLAWFAYWQEGQTWLLAVVAALMLLLLMHFPRRAALEQWIENGLHELQEIRSLGVQR